MKKMFENQNLDNSYVSLLIKKFMMKSWKAFEEGNILFCIKSLIDLLSYLTTLL